MIVWLGAGRFRVTRDGDAATVRDVNAGTMHHLPRGSDETSKFNGSPRVILFQLK